MVTDLRNPKFRLAENEYFAGLAEAEVRDASRDDDLADENTSGCPNIDTIATSAVYIAGKVTFDAIRNTCEVMSAQ
jgi:hypothetical protein